ncbi:cadherin-like domain-containing protein [Glaciecola sp. MH2013]|uniref:Ig-like domain-containing protein n=1 Tax=Glaciecola sp. MH2013 TaxID=2785524 RepID=UPI00189CBA1D|nr:Ig-like domain-containing protein [Glaciecola sp. MH2013]MBF7074277.1 cadherin-like domain-containing protein [Glaciecola sp. MH2013]
MKYLLPAFILVALTACSGGGSNERNDGPPDVDPAPSNNAPTAQNDSATTNNGQAVTINVLGNDTDANNDTLTISSNTQPQNGSVRIENNQLIYTPNSAAFAGTDTFSYVVSDSQATASAQVTVDVTQYTTFQGIVVGSNLTSSPIVRLSIGDEVFESQLDTQDMFSFDYETSTVDARDLVLSVLIDERIIYTSRTMAFSDIVEQRGTEVLLTFDNVNELVLSPLSTALEAMALRYSSENQRALEEQLDGDTLLELAAITSLIADGELSVDGDILDVLNNDALLETLARSLLLDNESVSRSSENINGVEGTLAVGTRLANAIDTVRDNVAPYYSYRNSIQATTSSVNGKNSAKLNNAKGEANAKNEGVLYDFYQLKPSYQGRVASYNFVGAQLTLMEDGTGTYWAEFGKSSLTWAEESDELVITLDSPIIYLSNSSINELNILGLISADLYSQARVFVDGRIFTSYINGFTLTRLFDGESVDIASTNFEINVVMDADVSFRDEAQTIGVDDYLVSLEQNLEYTETSEESYFPFENEELPGVWGFAVAASAISQSRSDDQTVLESIFADKVTFNADGTMQSQFHSVMGSWSIDEDGVLTVSQDDGWTVRYTRIAQDQQAFGMLIRANNEEEGKTFSQFRMAVKQSVTRLDTATIKNNSVLWNGNWGLSNPNNYNADGSFKSTGYFGFQFSNGDSSLSYLLGFLYRIGSEVEFVIRNRARYLVERDDLLIMERRHDRTQSGIDAECELTEPSCITFWRRQWTPLGQTEDRFYVLEHFYFNIDLIVDGNEGAPLYMQPRGRVIFYEKIDYPAGLLD